MMRRARTVVLCLVVAAVIGWGVAGHYMYAAFIGLDPQAFPAGWFFERVGEHVFPPAGFTIAGITLAVTVLIAMALASYVAIGRAVRASRPADDGRRRFLAGAASGAAAALATLAVGGAAAVANAWYGVGRGGRGWRDPVDEIFEAKVERTAPEWRDEWKGSRVQAHRRLGRTNWMVSDIVLGTGAISGKDGERIARLAIDRGVNYFDTSPDYAGAGTEDAMGRAIEGKRDELFIATKFCTPYGHLPPGTPVAEYMQAIEGSLRRLGTDHVDLVHIHSCDEVERLLDPNAHEAFDRLKEQGKVRFLGVSTHTPNLVAVANAAIASNRFDVIMLAYHHGIWAPLAGIIERAHDERDMGVVAMKTLKGAKHRGLADFRDHADSYTQAAFKWVLSNPKVSCVVVSFFELQHVDEYLYASGRAAGAKDVAILDEYDRQILGSYCAPHCGVCLDRCPEALPIHDVLRQRMYFEDYGWEKEAMRLYGALAKSAAICTTCPAPCLGSCPVGVPIQERMIGAHELLTLA